MHGLRRGNGGIGIAHGSRRNGTTEQNQIGLHAEKGRVPQHQVRTRRHRRDRVVLQQGQSPDDVDRVGRARRVQQLGADRDPAGLLEGEPVGRIYAEQSAEGTKTIEGEGVPVRELRYVHTADMQFAGQSHILSVGVERADISIAELHKAKAV